MTMLSYFKDILLTDDLFYMSSKLIVSADQDFHYHGRTFNTREALYVGLHSDGRSEKRFTFVTKL